MAKKVQDKNLLYQAPNGAIAFRDDVQHDTIWGTQKQIAEVFDVDVRTINEHLKNIFKTAELAETSTIRKFRIVQNEGNREVERDITHYNLDAILSVGYRVNSKQATEFRKWATQILKAHLVDGYTINKKRIGVNFEQFTHAVAETKALIPAGNKISIEDVLDLVHAFANTWFSLDAYDKDTFPAEKASKKKIAVDAAELLSAIEALKKELITKKQATDLFAKERTNGSVEGIIGNVFQTAFGKDVYPSTAEKAANLLYFMVKDHPFTDGNKRSGAFAFVWFLRKAGLLRASLTPEALTALTLLIAESDPKDKEKMVGLVVMLIK